MFPSAVHLTVDWIIAKFTVEYYWKCFYDAVLSDLLHVTL